MGRPAVDGLDASAYMCASEEVLTDEVAERKATNTAAIIEDDFNPTQVELALLAPGEYRQFV